MPTLASRSSRLSKRPANARPETNSDTVNPMPASSATPTSWENRTPVGQRADAEAHGDPGEQADADGLAHDEAEDDADGDARRVGDPVAA